MRYLEMLIYRCFASQTVRRLFLGATVLLLSGCEDDDESTLNEEGNYSRQALCWQTKIVDAVLKIINQLYAKSAADVVADGGAAVIAIGFSIWLAFKILKILPSFKEENLGEVWTEIGQKLFLCAFCMAIVSSTGNISWAMQTFVVPVYNTILELGTNVIGGLKDGPTVPVGEYGTVTFSSGGATCTPVKINIDGLKESISPMANCLICSISGRLNSGIKIGVALICTGNFGGIVVGILMVVLFTVAKFCFVLFVVDSLFRLNFAVLLLPLLMVGVPFNYTRKWSKHGFLMFLNSSGIMLFIGLLVSIGVGALENLVKLLNSGGYFTEENMEGAGPMLLAMILITILFINIPGLGVALADKFVEGGGGLEFQKKVSKFVINLVKKAGASILSTVTSGATNTITDALEKHQATREAMDNLKQMKSKVSDSLNSLAGYNND